MRVCVRQKGGGAVAAPQLPTAALVTNAFAFPAARQTYRIYSTEEKARATKCKLLICEDTHTPDYSHNFEGRKKKRVQAKERA